MVGLLAAAPLAGAGEFHVANEFSVTYNDVTGPGGASSSLTEGFRYLDVLGINGSNDLGRFGYSYNLGLKMTDDKRNDPKSVSLTNLQFKAHDRIQTLTVGDTFESFSQYTLGTALKGTSYRFYDEAANSPEVTLVYGLAYPRWDSLWHDDKTRMIERQAAGARLKYRFTPELSAGTSLLWSDDDRRLTATDPLYSAMVYELDLEYRPMPGLIIKGEAAFNATETEAAAGAAVTTDHGSAFKLEGIGDGGPSRVTLEYERVDPDFVALLGSATPDREKVKGRWKFKATKNLTVTTGLLWYRDNLENQLAATTQHYKPELGLALKRVLGRQYAAADLTYKFDGKTGAGRRNADHVVNLNYRDRFGLLDSESNLGYTRYDQHQRVRNAHEYTYNTSLSSRYSTGRLILKPALYLGGWTAEDELNGSNDRIYEYSVAMGLDIPDLKLTSSLKVGENRLDKDAPGTDDSKKAFGNLSIYVRPPFLAALNQGTLYLKVLVNDFRYTTGTSNFRETSCTAGLNFQL
jgi:hypothetical protein